MEIKKTIEKITSVGPSVMFQAFQPLAPMDASQGSRLSGIYDGVDLTNFVQKLFLFAISVGAIIAVLRFMYAGYLYMGSDLWTSKGKAIEIFKDVVLGLLLLLSIYLILQKINPQILNLDILKTEKSSQVQGLEGKSNPPAQPQAGCTYTDPDTGLCAVTPTTP